MPRRKNESLNDGCIAWFTSGLMNRLLLRGTAKCTPAIATEIQVSKKEEKFS